MSGLVRWKALQACFAGGAVRRAGEEFLAPDGEYSKAVRIKISNKETAGQTQKAQGKKGGGAPGVTPEELPAAAES